MREKGTSNSYCVWVHLHGRPPKKARTIGNKLCEHASYMYRLTETHNSRTIYVEYRKNWHTSDRHLHLYTNTSLWYHRIQPQKKSHTKSSAEFLWVHHWHRLVLTFGFMEPAIIALVSSHSCWTISRLLFTSASTLHRAFCNNTTNISRS